MTDEIIKLTADAVLFGDGRRGPGIHPDDLHVLLIRRAHAPFAGMWALPGGHVDAGEECMPAAHRELGEETDLTVPTLRPFAVYAGVGRDPRGRYVSFAYTVRVIGTPEPAAGDDAAEARWFQVNDVATDRVPTAFDHKRMILDASALVIGPEGKASAVTARRVAGFDLSGPAATL